MIILAANAARKAKRKGKPSNETTVTRSICILMRISLKLTMSVKHQVKSNMTVTAPTVTRKITQTNIWGAISITSTKVKNKIRPS